jgi:hypothetical protein
VIGIIALLVSILLPALTKARRQAQIVKCSANLHNIGIGLINYAALNRGWLPAFTGGGNWAWDMQAGVRNAIIRYGATRPNFYCPSNEAQNADALWNFNVQAKDVNGATLFNGSSGAGPFADASGNTYDSWPIPDETGFSVLGYIFLIKRLDGNMAPGQSGYTATPDLRNKHFNWQDRIVPHNVPALADVAKLVRPNISSQCEIAFDAFIADSLTNPTSFGAALGGWQMGGVKIPHQSAHWYSKTYNYGFPVGGNYLCLDGHVEWRPIGKNNYNQPNGFNGRIIIGPAGQQIAFFW